MEPHGQECWGELWMPKWTRCFSVAVGRLRLDSALGHAPEGVTHPGDPTVAQERGRFLLRWGWRWPGVSTELPSEACEANDAPLEGARLTLEHPRLPQPPALCLLVSSSETQWDLGEDFLCQANSGPAREASRSGIMRFSIFLN